ncbi:lipase chaperone [Sorangium cellulosum]|uniref:Lipase helper protein n=1 Tax=Sorangium cellulosum TaxID=56 RepID=A0A2L0EU28_SORCE|nr:lipase secretion chaperone [Sorangium cellulosum]AUX42801.1 lipase chaperone [Sorangium cellulosum]
MERRSKAGLLLGLALAALAGAGHLALRERPAPAAPAARPATRREATRPTTTSAAAAAPDPPRRERPAPAGAPGLGLPARPRAAPPSLRGTDVDGAVIVDERGDLVVGPEILALFDYFLSATGEEPAAAIRARIVAAIRERAGGRAADQAVALLDRYLGYREAAGAAGAAPEVDPAARLAVLRELRREHFGEADATRLFGDEEREGEAALDEARIAADPALSPEERDAQIAAVEAALPEHLRAAREAAMRPLAQQVEEQALRAAGASAEQIHAHRVAVVGPEAADRLAELDRQRAAWQERLDTFSEQRAAIAEETTDPQARRAAEEELLAREFTPEERLRVRALLRRAR